MFNIINYEYILAEIQHLDAQMISRGSKNMIKDINDALEVTCAGINLEYKFFLIMFPARYLFFTMGCCTYKQISNAKAAAASAESFAMI